MTRPGHAAARAITGSRSPFTGSDVCACAGLALVPGGRAVRFDEDLWDFGDVAGLPAYLPRASVRLDFSLIADPRWRLVAKECICARLAPAHPAVAALPGSYRVPLTLQSCAQRLTETAGWLNWLADAQITSLGQVTQDHCDRYLLQRARRTDAAGAVTGALQAGSLRICAAVIIELAGYRDLLTAGRYAAGFIPWRGRTSSQVVGFRPNGENKTPPLDEQTVQPLLAATFYLTRTLGPHVIALRREFREAAQARAGLRPAPPSLREVHEALDRHIAAGRPLQSLPSQHIQDRLDSGWAPDDPLLPVGFQALIHAAGSRARAPQVLDRARPAILAALRQVGHARPWARDAACVPPAGDGAAIPWTLPLDGNDIRRLACYLHTACLITTAMVTGMRGCELAELRVGCRRRTTSGPGLTRYRLAGKLIKGQGPGGTADEWVVIEEVDQVVALAEQLHDTAPGASVFGRYAFTTRYPALRAWVNGPAGQRLGLAEIPGSPANLRMMRRTLAQEIAYRPGGLLAAKIHLKHVSAATTEGYTARPGGAQAKLLAEIADHEADRNLALVAGEYRNYQAGIMPAGPGARELAAFFHHAGEQAATAPNIAATDQHLLNLLSRRAGILHLGVANYCWFAGPSRALCLKLADAPGADAPLIGMCDSARCPQATHHPRHRAVWADTAAGAAVFLGGLGRTRRTEHARLQAEADRAQRVLDAIDAAGQAGHADPAAGQRP